MKETENVFNTLSKVNVNDKTEKKAGLTYLSWSFAWSEVKKRYPDASYKVIKDENGMPFINHNDLGLLCSTEVTIEGETLPMFLPVMNGANKSMKLTSYEYPTRHGNKTVEAATMFDINKTIMRCLVKNLAMFGLGIYIYSGEDLPEVEKEVRSNGIIMLKKCTNLTQLKEVYKGLTKEEQIANKDLVTSLKNKLTNEK